jgi:hypothetical protein
LLFESAKLEAKSHKLTFLGVYDDDLQTRQGSDKKPSAGAMAGYTSSLR